jgi:hypothetical protein
MCGLNSNNLTAVKIYIFIFWSMKPRRLTASIYEEPAPSKFAASPVRTPNIEKVTLPFLIESKRKFMGENPRNKQNNRRRQFFQLLKVQCLLKKT